MGFGDLLFEPFLQQSIGSHGEAGMFAFATLATRIRACWLLARARDGLT